MLLLLLLSACRQDPADAKPADDTAPPVEDTGDGDTGPLDQDADGVVAAEDCDDRDASVFPGATEVCNGVDDNCDGAADEGVGVTWYADADADGWGDDGTAVIACAAAAGQVAVGGDCADDDPARHPGAAEVDCTDPVDYNCDGTSGRVDGDADGWAACQDCDDAAAGTNPDAAETCNGVDDDCDGRTDDGATDLATFYEDDDGDGFGDASDAVLACAATAGLVTDATDCDDRNAGVYPGAVETCDDADQDCDGAVDDGATDTTAWYLDDDGDGYGVDATAVSACDAPGRHVAAGGDCADDDRAVNPGERELCNDVDDNCDGVTDDDAIDRDTWYTDGDDDGYGDPTTALLACDAPTASIRNDRDCDDEDPAVRPYAWEDDTDGLDNDCDGLADLLDSDVVTDVALSDDAGTLVEPAAFSFPYCGNLYTNAYFESNGRVAFGGSDNDWTETAAEFAVDAAVAGLWDDLDPRYYAPRLAWIEHDDAVAFHWRGITQYAVEDASTFSIVLFDDGRMLLSWEGVAVTDTIVGYSCGSATTYTEFDLGAAMASRAAGRWGLGDGTEEIVYEAWDGSTESFDLAASNVRFCGNVAGGDPCADE